MIIPSIDLLDGQAVQLKQGKEKVLARDDVFELLEEFSLYGEVAIIDLNAALGKGSNRELIAKMLAKQTCRVGGGIRDKDTAEFYLKAGASKIIIGTSAGEPFVKELPKSKLIFAVDAKGDELVTHGWTKNSNQQVLDVLPELAKNCSEFLYTQVENEGMMQGIDSLRIGKIAKASPIPVTVAGGISNSDDVAAVSRLGCNAQLGMSIYTGAMSLSDAMLATIDFNKMAQSNGLIPTVVQDAITKNVLMLAYSSKESLQNAMLQRKGVYYSRSRQQLWEKGATSGNTQRLIKVDVDCDGDSLLFIVEQESNACHLNRLSCFASQNNNFNLERLAQVLETKKLTGALMQINQEGAALSYTENLLQDTQLQKEKLQEECAELIETDDFEQVRWEAADLLFFTLCYAQSNNVALKDIVAELGSRNRDY